MKTNKPNNNRKKTNVKSNVLSEENLFVSIVSCIHRTNVRFFVNLPHRIKNYIIRKYNDYKNKPKRKEINKVYVLIGYTTKQNIDNKYNEEHLMIVFRRFLLGVIFVLLLIITLNWVKPLINLEQYKQIFGIESVEEITSNDPFEVDGQPTSILQLNKSETSK